MPPIYDERDDLFVDPNVRRWREEVLGIPVREASPADGRDDLFVDPSVRRWREEILSTPIDLSRLAQQAPAAAEEPETGLQKLSRLARAAALGAVGWVPGLLELGAAAGRALGAELPERGEITRRFEEAIGGGELRGTTGERIAEFIGAIPGYALPWTAGARAVGLAGRVATAAVPKLAEVAEAAPALARLAAREAATAGTVWTATELPKPEEMRPSLAEYAGLAAGGAVGAHLLGRLIQRALRGRGVPEAAAPEAVAPAGEAIPGIIPEVPEIPAPEVASVDIPALDIQIGRKVRRTLGEKPAAYRVKPKAVEEAAPAEAVAVEVPAPVTSVAPPEVSEWWRTWQAATPEQRLEMLRRAGRGEYGLRGVYEEPVEVATRREEIPAEITGPPTAQPAVEAKEPWQMTPEEFHAWYAKMVGEEEAREWKEAYTRWQAKLDETRQDLEKALAGDAATIEKVFKRSGYYEKDDGTVEKVIGNRVYSYPSKQDLAVDLLLRRVRRLQSHNAIMDFFTDINKPSELSKRLGIEGAGDISEAHRIIVQRALAEGKPVPPEVLKEYPELAAKSPGEGARAPVIAEEGAVSATVPALKEPHVALQTSQVDEIVGKLGYADEREALESLFNETVERVASRTGVEKNVVASGGVSNADLIGTIADKLGVGRTEATRALAALYSAAVRRGTLPDRLTGVTLRNAKLNVRVRDAFGGEVVFGGLREKAPEASPTKPPKDVESSLRSAVEEIKGNPELYEAARRDGEFRELWEDFKTTEHPPARRVIAGKLLDVIERLKRQTGAEGGEAVGRVALQGREGPGDRPGVVSGDLAPAGGADRGPAGPPAAAGEPGRAAGEEVGRPEARGGRAGRRTAEGVPVKEDSERIADKPVTFVDVKDAHPDVPKPEVPDIVGTAGGKAAQPGVLMPHQRDGVNRIMTALDSVGGFLLADGAGAGKTRQGLAVANILRRRGTGKVLIVTERDSVIRDAWLREAPEVLDEPLRVWDRQCLEAHKRGELKDGIYVATYSKLDPGRAPRSHVPADIWDAVIFDESHNVKNVFGRDVSAQAQVAMRLANSASRVLFISATPFDRPQDAYYFLRRLGVVAGPADFEEWLRRVGIEKRTKTVLQFTATGRPVEVTVEEYRRTVSHDEYARRVSEQFSGMVQNGLALKREVGLKGLDVYVKEVQLKPEQTLQLSKILDALTRDPRGGRKRVNQALALMTGRRILELYKLDHVPALVKDALDRGRQVAVFVGYRSTTSRTAERLYGDVLEEYTALLQESPIDRLKKALTQQLGLKEDEIAVISGDSGTNAAGEVAAYQRGKKKVLIATIDSGSTGINLHDETGTAPRTQIMVTLPWSAMKQVQAAGRSHRLTSKSRTELIYLMADHMVDRRLGEILAAKMETLDAAVRGDIGKLDIRRGKMLADLSESEIEEALAGAAAEAERPPATEFVLTAAETRGPVKPYVARLSTKGKREVAREFIKDSRADEAGGRMYLLENGVYEVRQGDGTKRYVLVIDGETVEVTARDAAKYLHPSMYGRARASKWRRRADEIEQALKADRVFARVALESPEFTAARTSYLEALAAYTTDAKKPAELAEQVAESARTYAEIGEAIRRDSLGEVRDDVRRIVNGFANADVWHTRLDELAKLPEVQDGRVDLHELVENLQRIGVEVTDADKLYGGKLDEAIYISKDMRELLTKTSVELNREQLERQLEAYKAAVALARDLVRRRVTKEQLYDEMTRLAVMMRPLEEARERELDAINREARKEYEALKRAWEKEHGPAYGNIERYKGERRRMLQQYAEKRRATRDYYDHELEPLKFRMDVLMRLIEDPEAGLRELQNSVKAIERELLTGGRYSRVVRVVNGIVSPFLHMPTIKDPKIRAGFRTQADAINYRSSEEAAELVREPLRHLASYEERKLFEAILYLEGTLEDRRIFGKPLGPELRRRGITDADIMNQLKRLWEYVDSKGPEVRRRIESALQTHFNITRQFLRQMYASGDMSKEMYELCLKRRYYYPHAILKDSLQMLEMPKQFDEPLNRVLARVREPDVFWTQKRQFALDTMETSYERVMYMYYRRNLIRRDIRDLFSWLISQVDYKSRINRVLDELASKKPLTPEEAKRLRALQAKLDQELAEIYENRGLRPGTVITLRGEKYRVYTLPHGILVPMTREGKTVYDVVWAMIRDAANGFGSINDAMRVLDTLEGTALKATPARKFLIPEGVARELDNFFKNWVSSDVDRVLRFYTNFYKRALLQWVNFLPYHFNNTIGDTLMLTISDIRALEPRNLWRAFVAALPEKWQKHSLLAKTARTFREFEIPVEALEGVATLPRLLRKGYIKEARGGKVVVDLLGMARDAEDVFASGFSRDVSISHFYQNPEMRRLSGRASVLDRIKHAFLTLEYHAYSWGQRREAVLRLAKFFKDMERIQQGKSVVYPDSSVLKGMPLVHQAGAAARMALIDYTAVGPAFRKYLRDFLFPFATWYFNMFNYIYKDWLKGNIADIHRFLSGLDRSPDAQHRAMAALTRFGLAAIPVAGMIAWNVSGDRAEIERKLPEWVRRVPHIITGWTDDKGRQLVVYFQHPLTIAASMLGLDLTPDLVRRVAKGEITWQEALKEQAKATALEGPRRIAELATPLIRAPIEAAANFQVWSSQPVAYGAESLPEEVVRSQKLDYVFKEAFPPYIYVQRLKEALRRDKPPETTPLDVAWQAVKGATLLGPMRIPGKTWYDDFLASERLAREKIFETRREHDRARYYIQEALIKTMVTGNRKFLDDAIAQYGRHVTVRQFLNMAQDPETRMRVARIKALYATTPEERRKYQSLAQQYRMLDTMQVYRQVVPRQERPEVAEQLLEALQAYGEGR